MLISVQLKPCDMIEKLVLENEDKIVILFFGAEHAVPNKGTTILYLAS